MTPFKFPPGSEATLNDSEFFPGVPYRAKSGEAGEEDVLLAVGTRLKVIAIKNNGDDRICEVLDGPGVGRRIQAYTPHLR